MASANDEGVALLGELRCHSNSVNFQSCWTRERPTVLPRICPPCSLKPRTDTVGFGTAQTTRRRRFRMPLPSLTVLLPGGPHSIQPSAGVRFERPVDLPQLDDMERDRWVADCHRQCGSETHAQGC